MMIMKEYNKIKYLEINNSKQINTIIIPGYLQTHQTYQNLFQTICKYSNLYFIEIPGFGITDKLNEVINLDYYVIYLKEFIEHFKLDNVILFGHSFGGRIIVKYESLYNFSKCLVLMDIAGCSKRTLNTKVKIIKYKLLKKVYKTLRLKNKFKMLVSKSGSNEYKSLDDISKQSYSNIIKEKTTKYLKNIKTPTLLIWGKEDKETPLVDGLLINKLIKNSSLITIDNVGHFPNLECPILVNDILDNFYRGV